MAQYGVGIPLGYIADNSVSAREAALKLGVWERNWVWLFLYIDVLTVYSSLIM